MTVIDRAMVWVHILNLPIEYYACSFLEQIDNNIDQLVHIDDAMIGASRGKYAHLCVEIDMNAPLLSKFHLRRKILRIEYEGIHKICIKCRCYGHRTEVYDQDLDILQWLINVIQKVWRT